MRSWRFHEVTVPAGLALLVTWSALHSGLPALHHDWRYSQAGDAIGATLAGFSSGWLPQGLGIVNPYPTLYLIGFILWPLTALHSALIVVMTIIGGAIFIAARAGMRIGMHAGCTPMWCCCLAIVASLNPWVYCELVAGHIEMVLAYALLFGLVAELTDEKPRTLVLAISAALAVTQIEFLAVALVPISAWCTAGRRYAVLTAMLVAVAPIGVGIAASYDALRSIPYLLPWQVAASVPLNLGGVLLGYEFGYAKPFEPFLTALVFLGILAAFGSALALRRPVERVVIATALAALVFASGTKGPIAPLYTWLVLHVPESGIFRELYDLIAIVAIAYVVALGQLSALPRSVRFIAFAAACALCIPWIGTPITAWTVPAKRIPLAPVARTPETRVALFPAFQPLSFMSNGSGFDPDSFVRDGRAKPINEFYPTFPVDVALSRAESLGDVRRLEALGVTQVCVRPYLESQWKALRYQLIGAAARPRSAAISNGSLAGWPVLSLIPGPPSIVSIGNDPAENATFFGDVEAEPRSGLSRRAAVDFVHYAASRSSLDPNSDWVDARLAIASHPQWGTAFGGVITSTSKPLDTKNAVAILAQASGALVGKRGEVVVPEMADLHWWSLRRATAPVYCRGTCIVVMGATELPTIPEHGAFVTQRRVVESHSVFPWLVVAHVPEGIPGTLRYAVRYDRHWAALRRWRLLRHFRMATALNGWIIDAQGGGTIYLVEWLAVVQAVLEALCIATLGTMIALSLFKRTQAA